MSKGIKAILLWLLLAPVALAGETVEIDNSVLTMRVDGAITIDTGGKVVDYAITTPITAEMQQLLDRSVRNWTFQPVKAEDGTPANAKSGMRVTLAARPAGAGYRVSIDNVTFRALAQEADATTTGGKKAADDDGRRLVASLSGEPRVVATSMRSDGSYPKGLMRARVEGAVLLHLKLSPDGNIEDVVAVQSSLFNVRGRPAIVEQARQQFEDSAIALARRWKFEVHPGKSALTPADLTVAVPVRYVPWDHGGDLPGQWRTELRSEKRLVPWLLDAAPVQRIGISDIDGNEVLPLASRFRVPDGVIGTAL